MYLKKNFNVLWWSEMLFFRIRVLTCDHVINIVRVLLAICDMLLISMKLIIIINILSWKLTCVSDYNHLMTLKNFVVLVCEDLDIQIPITGRKRGLFKAQLIFSKLQTNIVRQNPFITLLLVYLYISYRFSRLIFIFIVS